MNAPFDNTAILQSVTDFITLDDAIKEQSAKLTALRKKQREIGPVIIKFLQENSMTRCDTPTRNLLLREETTQKSLSVPLLREVFNYYFGNSTRAEELLQAIAAHRKADNGARWRLKRVQVRGSAGGGDVGC